VTNHIRKTLDLEGPSSRYFTLLYDNPLFGTIHRLMFIPSIELLGNDEQIS